MLKEKIRNTWSRNDGRVVFISVMTVAAVTFFYYLTGEPKNSDCFNEGLLVYTNGDFDVSLGRWLTPFCMSLSWSIVNPLIHLIVYFLCDAVAAILLIDMWGIKGRILRILTGGIFAVAPAIVGQALYIHEMPTYAASLLLAFVSIFILSEYRGYISFIISSVFFALALGAFQSIIGVVFFVLPGCLFMALLGKDKTIKDFTLLCGRYAGFGVCGVLIYWVVLKVYLKASGIARPSYAGVDEVGLSSVLSNFGHYIKRPYWIFLSYYRDDPLLGNVFWGLLILTGVSCGIYVLFKVIKDKLTWKLIPGVILILVMPLGANIIDIITPEHGVQLYMTYQMQLLAPFCLGVICMSGEMMPENNEKTRRIVSLVTGICLAGLIWSYCFQAYCSFRTLETGSRYIKYCVQNALSHALEDEAYEEGMPVVFVGFVNDEKAQKMNPLRAYSYYDNAYPFWKERYEVFSVWRAYCAYYFGVDIGTVGADRYEAVLASDEFSKMTQYPSDGAFAVIDGCYVILMDRESIA